MRKRSTITTTRTKRNKVSRKDATYMAFAEALQNEKIFSHFIEMIDNLKHMQSSVEIRHILEQVYRPQILAKKLFIGSYTEVKDGELDAYSNEKRVYLDCYRLPKYISNSVYQVEQFYGSKKALVFLKEALLEWKSKQSLH